MHSRVLLIDVDAQGNVGHALGVHSDSTIREVMLGAIPPEGAIIRGVRDRLDIITSTPAVFSLEAQLAGATQRETNFGIERSLGKELFPSLHFNSVLFAMGARVRLIQYRDNLIPKLLFWPVLLMLVFAVSVYTFY